MGLGCGAGRILLELVAGGPRTVIAPCLSRRDVRPRCTCGRTVLVVKGRKNYPPCPLILQMVASICSALAPDHPLRQSRGSVQNATPCSIEVLGTPGFEYCTNPYRRQTPKQTSQLRRPPFDISLHMLARAHHLPIALPPQHAPQHRRAPARLDNLHQTPLASAKTQPGQTRPDQVDSPHSPTPPPPQPSRAAKTTPPDSATRPACSRTRSARPSAAPTRSRRRARALAPARSASRTRCRTPPARAAGL